MTLLLYKTNHLFLIIIIATLCFSHHIVAAPLTNIPYTITQPDGTLLQCFLSGDEYQRFLHTQDEFIILYDTSSLLHYISDNKLSDVHSHLLPVSSPKHHSTTQSNDLGSNKGPFTNIVAFVKFKNDEEYTSTYSFYDSVYNSKTGVSLHGYFHEVSYQKLNVTSYLFPTTTNNIINSFQDDYPRNYYLPFSSSNSIGFINYEEGQKRKSQLLINVIKYLNNVVPNNIKLDNNVSGKVDNVTIVLRGASDA